MCLTNSRQPSDTSSVSPTATLLCFLIFFVCVSFPIYSFSGDLYGGAHYSQSCSASLTPQGRAIHEASIRFGDGYTLPFTPCKKGYSPINATGECMCACPLHEAARRKRLEVGGNKEPTFRAGEVNLTTFWSNQTVDKKKRTCTGNLKDFLDQSS